jgi:hypothetical protein
LVTPVLGTPTSGTLTNCTGLPVATGVSGLGTGVATFLETPTSANLAAAVTGETGSGALVFATSPTLVTPALGTPSSGTLTSCTSLPIVGGTTGTLTVARGGTGVATLTGVVYGNGTGNFSVASGSEIATAIGSTAVTNATNATNSTNATRITNAGGWNITPSGATLFFSYNGTNVASLDSSGNFKALANIGAFVTP